MKKVNYGIIGCGMGRAHMAGLKLNNSACLTAICDINPEAMAPAAAL